MIVLEYIWNFFWAVVSGFFIFFSSTLTLFGLVLAHFIDEKKMGDGEVFFGMVILASAFFGLIFAILLFIYDDVTSLKIAFWITVSVALIIRIIYAIIKKRKNKAED